MAQEAKYGRLWVPNVSDEEPIFILRAQDKLASDTIRFYAMQRGNNGDDKGAAACMAVAHTFDAWPTKKMPD